MATDTLLLSEPSEAAQFRVDDRTGASREDRDGSPSGLTGQGAGAHIVVQRPN